MSTSNQTHSIAHDDTSEKVQAVKLREIAMLTQALLDAEDALHQEREAHDLTWARIERLEYEASHYAELINSTSWRITAPLRWVVTKVRH